MQFLSLWITAALINIVLLGLPLIFWFGWDSVHLDVRSQLILFIVTIWIACDMNVDSPGINHYRHVEARLEGFARILYLLPFLLLVGIWIAISGTASESFYKVSYYPQFLGTFFCALGIYLRHLSITALGAFFSAEIVVLKFQHLVTSGIFKHIRHPSYTGLLLLSLGIPLIAESTTGMAFWLIVILPLVITTVNKEEEILFKAFGVEFENYQNKTGKLIPLSKNI